MNQRPEHIEPAFKSGADGVIGTLLHLGDTIVVVSKGIRDGYRIQIEGRSERVRFREKAGPAMSYAIGLAMTGQPTSVVLDTHNFEGVRAQLHAALLRHLPLTVVIARNRETPFDPIEEFGEIGCPLLCASGAQSLMDLSVVAHAVAKTAMMPVLIAARAQQSLWTYQQLFGSPSPGELSSGEVLDFYRTEILGDDGLADHAWIDPANPLASGIASPGEVRVKRTMGRKIFVENELPELIDRAMQQFSAASGRTCTAVESTSDRPAEAVLIETGPVDDTLRKRPDRNSGFSIVHVTRVRPFPADEVRSHLSHAQTVGILCEANGVSGKGAALLGDVRSVLDGNHTNEHRRIWNRANREDDTRKTVVPVWHAPDWEPSAGDVDAIGRRLSRIGPDQGPLVVGVRLSADELRLPAVEEIVQRMHRSGISFAGFEVRTLDDTPSSSEVLVIAESIHSMWPLVQGVCGLLEMVGARQIRGSLYPGFSAASSPVIGRITFDAGVDAPAFVLCPTPGLLHSLPAREAIPREATVLTLSGDAGRWPFWMTEKQLSLRTVSPGEASPATGDLLLGAFTKSHSLFSGMPDDALMRSLIFKSVDDTFLTELSGWIREAEPEAFDPADQSPPETAPPAELTDRAATSLPIANLLLFWKSLGHLYRSARLADAPVDAWLTSHYLPASTGPLLGRGGSSRPAPGIIAERCTGCGTCWAICPESAIVVRPFSVESMWNTAMASASRAFVHLPRLAPAVIKTAHRLIGEDERHEYPKIGDLLTAAFARVMDKAGLEGNKRQAVETERDVFLASISNIRPIRTERWFEERETVEKGGGALLGIGIDPDACTSCGLCVAACPDDAMETGAPGQSIEEWHQLAALPALPGEDWPSDYFEHPAAALVGKTSRRVFRAGSSDTANLNRTALRLFLESQQENTARIRSKMLEEVDAAITRIDARLQQTIDESVRINDFDRFARDLRDAGKGLATNLEHLFEDRPADTASSLALLATCRARLQEEKSRLEAQTGENLHPHMVLVDATTNRSLGLAPYPINPFSMPCFRADAEEVADLISGITRGFIDRFSRLSRELRVSRQMLDDVLDSSDGNEVLPEDTRWAESALPHVTLVTDRIDFTTIRTLGVGPHVRILALNGGEFPAGSNESIDAAALAYLLDEVWIAKQTIADPVRLLAAFSDGVSGTHAALFQVCAPDPVRDGIQPEDALAASDLAERSGVFRSFVKEPGKILSIIAVEDESVSAADWMILQARFADRFEVMARSEWATDQMPVAEWIRQSDEERAKLDPYVEYAGRRYRPDAGVLAFSQAVFAARTDKTVRPSVIDAGSPPQKPAQPASAKPGPVHPDALAVLTRKLLAMSGYANSNESLTRWLSGQEEEATE